MFIIFLGRFVIDIGTRMVFPFIPQISAGMGLTIVAFSWLISLRTLAGVSSLIFGLLSDQYGRRKIMALGLLCQAVGVLGLALFEQTGAIVSMVIFGLALSAYIPAQQAYISDLVPYHIRGRSLAIIEISWAASAIFMLPVIGWMIDNLGWRWPFIAVGLLSLIGSTIVWLRLPPVESRSQATPSWATVRQSCLKFNVLAAIVVSLLVFLTVNIYVSVWGIWLTADFGLAGVQLGFVQSSIGLAEFTGSIASSLFIDRLGKRWGSGLSLLLTAFFLALLPLTQHNFLAAIATLVSIGLLVEFAIVSLIPIYSEQAPEARGTVLALTLLGAAIGGTIGTPLAATLWEQQGLGAVCVVAATSLCLAVIILWKFLQEAPLQVIELS